MPFTNTATSSYAGRLVRACGCALTLWAIAGCNVWRPSAPPLTSEQLVAMTPDTCSSALVFPSFDDAYQALLMLLDRAAPENVDIEVEAQVLTRPLATLAGEQDAIDVIDIAMAKGVDPLLPLALYLGPVLTSTPPAASAAEAQPSSMFNPAAVFSRLIEQRPFAAVLPEYSRKFMEQAVADWSKGKAVREEPLAGLDTPLRVREDGRLCWYFTPEGLVIGNSVDFVKAVAARRQQPANIPHNAAETDAADLIQIVRGSEAEAPGNKTGPLGVMSRVFSTMLASPDENAITVIAWRIGESTLEAAARRSAGDKTAPEPLRLAPLLPTDATGVLAVSLSGQGKALVRDLTNELGAQTSLPGDAQDVLESLTGELAIATTEGSPGRPNVVLLAQLAEGKARDTLTNTASVLAIETYNGVEIISVPAPGDSGYEIQFALVGDVLAAGTEMGGVKTAIDRLQSGKPSGLFARLDPPLDPAAPPRMALVANAAFVSDTFVPLLSSRGALPFERADAVEAAFTKIQGLRVVSAEESGETVTRLVLRVQ